MWYPVADAAPARARANLLPELENPALATILNCVFVGLGGLVGSVLRYLVSLVPLRHTSGFPLVTLGINILGAFVLGLIMALAGKNTAIDPRALLFLKVGVCGGGFTTFSTFALEAHSLIGSGKPMVALLYALLSVVLSVFAVFAAGIVVK
jgi:fluoride exporter